MDMIDDYTDVSIFDFNSIISYIKNNYIQILLLITVFFIIYTVDYISNINSMLIAPISIIPVIPNQKSKTQQFKMPKGRKTSKK